MSKIFWKRTDNERPNCDEIIMEAESMEELHKEIKSIIADDANAEFEVFICENAVKVTAGITLRMEPFDV